MADYYAVLNRTLSGFGNANAQLRTKLYERARLTIRGQLEGRKPALDDAAMAAEMEKLEQAIAKIEKENGDEVATASPVPVSEPKPETSAETPEKPVAEKTPEAASEPASKPKAEDKADDKPKAEPTPEVAKPAEESTVPELASKEKAKDNNKPDDSADAKPEDGDLPPNPLSTPDETEKPVPDEKADPILEAISEFTEADADRQSEQAAVLEDVKDPTEIVEAKLLKDVSVAVDAASEDTTPVALEPESDFSDPAATELDPVLDNEDLSIPPASDAVHQKSSAQRISRWVSVILLVLAIGAALWAYQKPIMIALGLAEDPTRPKPVKTIAIKPEPEKSETDEPQVEVAEEAKPEPTPTVEEPVVPEPKTEERLTENGEETQPAAPVEPVVQPETPTETAEPGASDPKPVDVPDTGIQTAILYEKNPLPPSKGLDAGNARWSVVQEAPASGQPEEPAIRAEVEIPTRNTVMIMTIKRNADPALTASHLIELIFAVPDDFSGGAVNTINRIVLKENEQDRGAPLEAVPVKISDGIFLIALDNLATAQQKNENLLKTRTWIDIPLQYRTGAQALITIEKGAAGQKIFDEVFAAWDAIAKKP